MEKKYVTVFKHRGFDIQTLKTATPSRGDNLGYTINNGFFAGRNYRLIDDAIDDIDRKLENEQNQCSI
ncbi:hypothetical protein [Paenibacillus algicola]|uniref:hypothetical protein n=1 Tax=Paenibacillus algicola TaxID=2565926 RepID=UPI0010FD33AE|nr:hypothetical protein [Paenibacillus algicola]